MQWKHALMEFVEDRLEQSGLFEPEKLRQRNKMKPKKLRDLANSVVDEWGEGGTIQALYRDFKGVIENARNKSTTGGARGR